MKRRISWLLDTAAKPLCIEHCHWHIPLRNNIADNIADQNPMDAELTDSVSSQKLSAAAPREGVGLLLAAAASRRVLSPTEAP
eukprot:3596711-Pleurochrysis_carterae.AAC.2